MAFCLLFFAVETFALTDAGLGEKRAEKRAAMRAAVAASSEPVSFALLVIPVDFVDNRLPSAWEPSAALGDRLFPLEGESLANFFHLSSGGRLALNVVLAPLIHLSGETADYRDYYPADTSHTRRLATEAIEAAAGGLDFRLLDDDGPDRLPGTADDDGEVDGVLILHADVGDELDPENGLIRALSFYLDEAVSRNGILASAYSVASLHSGTGIWAHETGHLFGLEERYDRGMPTLAGEILSRGGLGIFSVMSAGAWGAGGDGNGAALVDAYSASLLGWCDVRGGGFDGADLDTLRHRIAGGRPIRVWTRGGRGEEYFLLETRGGAEAAPFDAAIPEGHLIVMHVDESLPEAAAATSPYHIRVNVLEADGGDELLRGEAPGSIDDLFPGSYDRIALAPGTTPSSNGYSGNSEISLTEITTIDGGVSLRIADFNSPGVDVDLAFTATVPAQLVISVFETGTPVVQPAAELTVVDDNGWGSFDGGALSVTFELEKDPDGVWRPVSPVAWHPTGGLPVGATSEFSIAVAATGWQSEAVHRSWTWRPDDGVLDYDAAWPGAFTVLQTVGDPRTSWYRWEGAGGPAADGSAVLACVGTDYEDGTTWPETRYENGADVVLLSGALAEAIKMIRIVHAFDGEEPYGGLARDGAVIEFLSGNGFVYEGEPIGGYGGSVDPVAHCALHGRDAFTGEAELDYPAMLRWRVDYVPVPGAAVPPVKLRLRLASNSAYAGLGWFVADLEGLSSFAADGFATVWNAGGDSLVWTDPGLGVTEWGIEGSAAGDDGWTRIWQGLPDDDAGVRKALAKSTFDASAIRPVPGYRHLLRVFAVTPIGDALSRPVVLCSSAAGTDDGPLGMPWLDAGQGKVRMMLDLPVAASASLEVFDLRGRRVRRWDGLGGQQYFEWDTRDYDRRAVAAGTYLFRLRHGAVTTTRKVIVLR